MYLDTADVVYCRLLPVLVGPVLPSRIPYLMGSILRPIPSNLYLIFCLPTLLFYPNVVYKWLAELLCIRKVQG